MLVVSLTDCPPSLRGDLSKWLLEINTGVYVGQVNARVRDKLWNRITEHIKHGKATMVFDAPNEQGLDFRVHNTSWEVVDCDGLKLIRRPSVERMAEKMNVSPSLSESTPYAARQLKMRRIENTRAKAEGEKSQLSGKIADFTVLDIETTGLNPAKDEIIEVAALRVRSFEACEAYSTLIQTDTALPSEITALTGIKGIDLCRNGIALEKALKVLCDFIGDDVLLIHNAAFDLTFLKNSMKRCGLPMFINRSIDTCMLARKARLKLKDYKLSTLANYYGVKLSVQHRALEDCKTALGVYQAYVKSE